MSFIQLKSVRKSYDGTKEIIKPLDIEIQEGEFIVMVGPSGCGKSTLLRMIAGLEEVSAGEIWIDHIEVTHKEPKDRQIAMVFQNYALYPHMTVFDNIAYGLKIRGETKEDIQKKVEAVSQILSLNDLLSRKPKALSGGQRQRVAMGRAIVREPALFLFDEPLSNLDAKLRVQMRLELKALQERLKITSIYVTHDQVEAMTLADRVIIMNQGIAEQIGTPEALYHDPQSTFVASFIGSPAMNLLNGSIDESGKAFLIDKNINLSLASEMNHLANQDIIMGIRPEHIQIINNETRVEDKIYLNCKVNGIEHLGADNLVYTQLAGQSLLIRCPYDVKPAINQHINVSILKDKFYFFNTTTGQRIKTA